MKEPVYLLECVAVLQGGLEMIAAWVICLETNDAAVIPVFQKPLYCTLHAWVLYTCGLSQN